MGLLTCPPPHHTIIHNSIGVKITMKYLIVGNSVYASMLYDYLNADGRFEIAGFTVEADYITNNSFEGLNVIPFENIEKDCSPNSYKLFMGVGYSEMNDVKEHLFEIYRNKGYRFETYIHPSAIIPSDLKLGEGNVFFEGVIVQRGCVIGDCNVFFARTLIAHNCSIGNYNSFSFASLAGHVIIQNKCFMGMGSVLNEKITIEDRVFIGANAYVNESIHEGRAVLGEKGKIVDRDISSRIM